MFSLPVLHLIHGYIGAGKTTFAKRLAKESHATRFTPDEWIVKAYGDDPPVEIFGQIEADVKAQILKEGLMLLEQGRDVIFDFGLWTLRERDLYRQMAKDMGAECRLYFIDTDFQEAKRRTLARTFSMPEGTLVIDENAFEILKEKFEPLGPDENFTLVSLSLNPSPSQVREREGAQRKGEGGFMIYQAIKQKLKSAGIEMPELEARIFLREFAGVTDADILTGNIPVFDETTLNEAIARRIAGEPVGRILGYREFWGRKFYLSPATLEPRPDTETLIEAVLKNHPLKNFPLKNFPLPSPLPEREGTFRILDLGTGTGCILLTLLHEFPGATGIGVDLSSEACETARRNAREQGIAERVSFVNGSWGESLDGKFDLIVSNPPYISTVDVSNLESNVRDFDPNLALDGGNDGLDAYRNLLGTLKNLLVAGGVIYFEIGIHQLDDLTRLIDTYGATLDAVYDDLGGIPRVLKISYGDK